MRKRSLAAVFAVLFSGAFSGALAGDPQPIVVELYTSQGCSSCPPADALLGKLAKRKDLIAMSLPITYWDMLGWKDTLASDANTRRQKAYAAAMGRGGVYTPQIIVEGVSDVVGSREDEVEEAIDAAREAQADAQEAIEDAANAEDAASTQKLDVAHRAWGVSVALSQTPRNLHVAVAAATGIIKHAKPNATIWMFRLRDSATVRIGAGENGGRTMTYRNVVSEIRDVGHWKGEAMSFDLPPANAKTPPHDGVAVVLQQGGYGRVIGAAYLGHTDYYAQK